MRGVPDDDETENYRVWALAARTSDGGPAVVYVGPSLESAQEAGASLVSGLLVAVPLLVVALCGLVWVLVGRTLRPVETIRAGVSAVDGRGLDRRVPEPPTGDEVARLAVTMNAMLARLEEADTRQREFVAHASHDLQSPLTALRAELEVALADPERADWPAVARGALAESDRMETLVRDLLFLARSDGGGDRPARLLDLDDVAREEIERARTSSPVPVACSLQPAPVRGHPDDLARLVRNLLSNAVRHAQSAVTVTLATEDGNAVLHVTDDGAGVSAADRERVFERFVRLDEARRRTGLAGEGTGLGLAIVRSVAAAHGGTARLVDASTVEVRLPTV
jgi:signal transduction histidine kinase